MTNPATPTPPAGGMPKWLIILLVILIVIIIGCCGGITSCWFLARKVVKSAPDFIREQAQKSGMDVNIPGSAGGAVKLPANFPADIPPFAGATIIISSSAPNGSGSVHFSTPSSAADVKTFYDQELAKNDWKAESSQQTGEVTNESFSKDTRTADIQIMSGSPTHVTIIYAKK